MMISKWPSLFASSVKGFVKAALQSRLVKPLRKGGDVAGGSIIILGNGPSLKETLAEYADRLREFPTMAVNFAANAPGFMELKPDYYLLADPHFFKSTEDPNVAKLLHNLNGIDFPMTLFLPASVRNADTAFDNPLLTLKRFNAVGVEGFAWVERLLFNSRLAMPRPRNVLIPAIMVSLWLGFKEIYLAGADHSWLKTLAVNEKNEVVSVQPHFYKEDAKEKERVISEYRGYRLHQIIYSFYVAFSSYFSIARYAASRGVAIYNSTPGSFIDAFPRRQLPFASK